MNDVYVERPGIHLPRYTELLIVIVQLNNTQWVDNKVHFYYV